MKSRERVLSSLNHKQPDRVAIDFAGHRSSGINAIAYSKLRNHLCLDKKPIRVYDPIQQLAIVDDDVLDMFGVDTVELGRAFACEDNMWEDWTLPDGTACQLPIWVKPEYVNNEWILRSTKGKVIARMPDGALYFEQTCFPFMDNDDLDNIPKAMEDVMWSSATCACPPGPLARGSEGLNLLSEGAKKFRTQTDRAIIGLFGGSIFEMGQQIYRNDNYFLLLAGEPDRAHQFLDKLMEIHMSALDQYLKAVGDNIDIIIFGDDLGMQACPQISPIMYREFFKPRHKLMWEKVKKTTKAKVMLHCCGSIKELLPDLIDAGLDAVNPVQISCANMDSTILKREFGKDLVFWGGGCDTQVILPQGSPETIRRHVKEQVKILSPNGGFVFQQVHNILADVPPENIVCMFDSILG